MELIAGLSEIDQDFETAMQILQAEYDRPCLIRHALMTRLQSVQDCDQDGKQLRSVYTEFTTLIHQLCPEGEIDSPDFLVNVMITYLQTRIMKEAQRKPVGVFTVLGIMREAVVEDRIERLTVSRPPGMTHPPPPSPPSSPPPLSTPPVDDTTHSTDRTINCRLCDGFHFTKNCSHFSSPQDKKAAAIRRRLCINCLSPHHQVDYCPDHRRCRHCREPHHTTLCTGRSAPAHVEAQEHSAPHPPRSSHRPPTTQQSRPPFKGQPARDVCNFIYSEKLSRNEPIINDVTLHINSSLAPHEKQSLLLCLDVGVASPDHPDKQSPVTLFDSGSNGSYVSKDLVTDLSLPTTDERIISVTVFDNEKPSTRNTTTHPLLIRLPDGRQERVNLRSADFVCPPIDWAQEKDGLIVPRCSRPKILLGLDLLRRFFLTPSLRIHTYPDHIAVLTVLGTCISIEIDTVSKSMPSLTDSKKPPDKPLFIGDNPQEISLRSDLSTLNHSSLVLHPPIPTLHPADDHCQPTFNSTLISQPRLGVSAVLDPLENSNPLLNSGHWRSGFPMNASGNTAHLIDCLSVPATATDITAQMSLHSDERKDKDNPRGALLYASTAHSRRAGG